MKKILLIVLAGMMMLVFTQCGSNGGTKQYRDTKAFLERVTELLNNAETCDDLDELTDETRDQFDAVYEKKDKLSKEEEDIIDQMLDNLRNLVYEKAMELCYDD